jgi:hypothetical protein
MSHCLIRCISQTTQRISIKFGNGIFTESCLKHFNQCVLVKVCSLIRPQTFVHKVMNILFPQRVGNIFSRQQYIVSFCTANQVIARRSSVAEFPGPFAGQFVLADQVADGQVFLAGGWGGWGGGGGGGGGGGWGWG